MIDRALHARRRWPRSRATAPSRAGALALALPAILLGACDARIGEPRALWALWLLPALVAFYVFSLRARSARLRRFASLLMLERLTGGASARRSAIKAGLVVVAVAALLVSLAQLQMGYTWEEVQRRGVDIVVALDVSNSMRVEDAGERTLSRLERAKRELHDLLQLLSGDRIGIVAFAGTAFVQCPMTLDYGAAELFLDALDTDSIPVQGTDLAQALEASLKAFRGGAAGSRAILLITDGEDHSERAVEVAERLHAEGVRVFAIGIGSPEGAPIPAEGGGFRRDSKGGIILSRLDEATLQQVALLTDGRYVRSVSGDLDLEQIYVEGIKATLEDREFEAHRRQRWEDRFQWLLGAAVALLMIEGLIPERARPRRARSASTAVARRGDSRSSAARAASILLAVALSVLAAPRAGAQAQPGKAPAASGGSAQSAHRASGGAQSAGGAQGRPEATAAAPRRYDTPEEAYEAGDYAQALAGFVDLEVERPEDAAVTMNVGSSHYRLGDLDAAVRSFEGAGARGDDRQRAQAFYDLGNVAFKQGRLEEAIESYHRSLDLDPADADAKYNLEVSRVALERQREQQKQQQQQQQQQKDQQPSPGGQPKPEDGEGDSSKQQGGGDSQPQPDEGNGEQGPQSQREQDRKQGPDGAKQPGETGAQKPGERNDGRDPNGAAGGEARQGADAGMTTAEAQRLLDSLEEGRPRRKVPPGRHRDQEKDW